jgi:hypothetical protein
MSLYERYNDEAEFREKFVKPLLNRLGFYGVSEQHGSQEFGKDFVFSELHRLGGMRHHAAQVKHEDPRFNMPFELGLFLGAKHYGRGAQDRKACLVFERDPNTYDKFISDFSGHDIKSHGNQAKRVVQAVRNWLAGIGRKRGLPGGAALWNEYQEFKKWIKGECSLAKRLVKELTWGEYVDLAVEWTKQSAKRKRH